MSCSRGDEGLVYGRGLKVVCGWGALSLVPLPVAPREDRLLLLVAPRGFGSLPLVSGTMSLGASGRYSSGGRAGYEALVQRCRGGRGGRDALLRSLLGHVPLPRVFGITSNALVRSSQSSSGPAGGASDGYGLGRGAAGPDRRCTTTAAGALRVIV